MRAVLEGKCVILYRQCTGILYICTVDLGLSDEWILGELNSTCSWRPLDKR